MVVWGYLICRRDIPQYLNDNAMAAIRVWRNYRVFGLPFAGGWAEQPGVFWDAIETLEYEARRRQEPKPQEQKPGGLRGRK